MSFFSTFIHAFVDYVAGKGRIRPSKGKGRETRKYSTLGQGVLGVAEGKKLNYTSIRALRVHGVAFSRI